MMIDNTIPMEDYKITINIKNIKKDNEKSLFKLVKSSDGSFCRYSNTNFVSADIYFEDFEQLIYYIKNCYILD
jgi:hypothetical protein